MSDDLDRLARAVEETGRTLELDPIRRARMRQRVLSLTAPRAGAGDVRGLARRWAFAAAPVFLALLGLGGAASASLPGDPAFGLKVQAEQLQLLLSPNGYARLDTSLAQADRRLGEIDLIWQDSDRLAPAADAYTRTLADVRDAVDAMAASDHSERGRALADARVDLDRHVTRLSEIREFTDGDIERALRSARDVARHVEEIEADGGGSGDRGTPSASPSETPTTNSPGGGSGPGPGNATASPPPATPRPTATAEVHNTPGPSNTPGPNDTPAPLRTASPQQTADPAKTPDPTRTPDPTHSPDETRTPSPSPTRS